MNNIVKRLYRSVNAAMLLVALLVVPATAKAQELLIDDFTTGPIVNPLDYELQGEGVQITQTQYGASIVGGSRRTTYRILPDTPGRPRSVESAGKLSIHTDKGLLVVSGDYQTPQSLGLRYPIPEWAKDFSAFSQLQVEFEGIDRHVNLVATLCSNNCSDRIMRSINVKDKHENRVVETLDFEEFRETNAFDKRNVIWLFVAVHNQHGTHAEDFGLSRISVR